MAFKISSSFKILRKPSLYKQPEALLQNGEYLKVHYHFNQFFPQNSYNNYHILQSAIFK